jgi:SAM-dependent methyltransferase
MAYYQVALDEELKQVNRAVDYYLSWGEEFRSTKYEWDFIYYYYRGLLNPNNIAGIRFRALFFAMRLQPVLTYVERFIQEYARPPFILDLGCGFGLESLLIALTGARVYGIDDWVPMIDHAKRRLDQYQNKLNVSVDLRYERANLFKRKESEVYDAVYSSATLHHIEPPTDAFQAIARLIKPDGYFFLSDENGYSSIQQLAVQKKIGWIHPRKYLKVDPDTGEQYMYGNENIRASFLWAKYMKRSGLQPLSIKYCRFLPPVNWPIEQLVNIERRIRTIPFIAQLGAIGFLYMSKKKAT